MGLFKSLGKVVGGAGDLLKKASPLASFIPGVGPIAAAGLGAVGALAGKANDKHVTLGNTLGSMAGGAALGGIGGYGIDKLQGMASGGAGLGGVAKGLFGSRSPASAVAGVAGQAPAAGGLFGKALDFAKTNPQLVLGGLGALNSARQQSGADNSRNTALQLMQQDMQNRQPFFQMMAQRMAQQPQGVDLSAILRDSSNPFAR